MCTESNPKSTGLGFGPNPERDIQRVYPKSAVQIVDPNPERVSPERVAQIVDSSPERDIQRGSPEGAVKTAVPNPDRYVQRGDLSPSGDPEVATGPPGGRDNGRMDRKATRDVDMCTSASVRSVEQITRSVKTQAWCRAE